MQLFTNDPEFTTCTLSQIMHNASAPQLIALWVDYINMCRYLGRRYCFVSRIVINLREREREETSIPNRGPTWMKCMLVPPLDLCPRNICMRFDNFCTSFQALKPKVWSSNMIHCHLHQRVQTIFLDMWLPCLCRGNEVVYDVKCQNSRPCN